jgi:hypothetical protein
MNQEQFGVQVITGKQKIPNPKGTFYGNEFVVEGTVVTEVINSKYTYLSYAEDQSSDLYINPSGKFQSSIVRDENNMIRGIIFKQQ